LPIIVWQSDFVLIVVASFQASLTTDVYSKLDICVLTIRNKAEASQSGASNETPVYGYAFGL